MPIPEVKPVTKRQRMRSFHLLIYAIVLAVLCLILPLLLWLPFLRKEVYSTLTMAKIFAMGGDPTALERRPWGLWIWDRVHPHTVGLALTLFVLGIPAGLWFWLDLDALWSAQATNQLSVKLNIVQLVAATLVGSVAISVFLSYQLPRMQLPRIHACFLLADPNSEGGHLLLARRENQISLWAEKGIWLHVLVANVGTIYYPRFTVSFGLPKTWSATTLQRAERAEGQRIDWHITNHPSISPNAALLDSQRPVFIRPYTYSSALHRIYFDPRDDPQDTGPGASSIYSFFVVPSRPEGKGDSELRVYVSSDQAGGQTVKTLKVKVPPRTASSPTG